jgi:hypothetical protein
VKFAADYVLFCHITTRVPTDKHQDLLEKKGGQGFPHIVFMDADGNVLAEHNGARSAEAFGQTGKKASDFIALREKAAKGDAAAKADYLAAQMELGHVDEAEADARLKDLQKLTPEQRKKFDGLKSALAVKKVMEGVDSEQAADEAGKKFLEMKKAGRPEPPADEQAQPYWVLMMRAAEKAKDVETYETALKALKARFGSNPRAQGFFKNAEKTLEGMKEKK